MGGGAGGRKRRDLEGKGRAGRKERLMYPQQGLGAFWPDSGKEKDVGSLPSAYPSLLDPTILLPFRGLGGWAPQGSPVSPGSAFGQWVVHWKVCSGLLGLSATEALGKRTKGISWCLGKEGIHRRGPLATHFSTSRW